MATHSVEPRQTAADHEAATEDNEAAMENPEAANAMASPAASEPDLNPRNEMLGSRRSAKPDSELSESESACRRGAPGRHPTNFETRLTQASRRLTQHQQQREGPLA